MTHARKNEGVSFGCALNLTTVFTNVRMCGMSDALNRRGFLGLAGGVGLAALTGCGTEDEPVAQPKQGGRLRAVYAGGGAKEVLDPHVQSLFVDIARHKAMYEKLVELGPDLKPVPRLASKWDH